MTGFFDKPGGLTGADVRGVTFGKPPLGKRGYSIDDVDRFLDLAAAAFDGGQQLRSTDVGNVRFGKPGIGKRGYDEQSVDDFLDTVQRECERRGW